MRAILTVDMDNAAFTHNPGRELKAVLLRAAAVALEVEPGDNGANEWSLRDSNGNRVGELRIEEE